MLFFWGIPDWFSFSLLPIPKFGKYLLILPMDVQSPNMVDKYVVVSVVHLLSIVGTSRLQNSKSAIRQVLFVSTPNNRRIYKTTTNLKFHIVKGNENDKYVK